MNVFYCWVLNEGVYVIVDYCLDVFGFIFLELNIFDVIFCFLIKYDKNKNSNIGYVG